ncbi:MAG: hypothetical protein WC773_04605 [Patescibacteria group bacterium]|jgi:hypothetical protein
MLGNQPECIYACDKLCNHPKKAKQNDNDDEIIKVEFTSRYSIDGMTNHAEARITKRAWDKAASNRIADKFADVPWISALAKEFRTR